MTFRLFWSQPYTISPTTAWQNYTILFFEDQTTYVFAVRRLKRRSQFDTISHSLTHCQGSCPIFWSSFESMVKNRVIFLQTFWPIFAYLLSLPRCFLDKARQACTRKNHSQVSLETVDSHRCKFIKFKRQFVIQLTVEYKQTKKDK